MFGPTPSFAEPCARVARTGAGLADLVGRHGPAGAPAKLFLPPQGRRRRMVTVHDIVLFGGFIANVVAVGISILLTFLVIYYQKKQTSSYEAFYKKETVKNLREIEIIFNEVDRMSTVQNMDDPKVIEQASFALEKYFKQQAMHMKHIVQRNEMYLDKWATLTPMQRNDIAEATMNLQWLTTDYYPGGKSFNTKKRTWPKQYQAMHEKADYIKDVSRNISAI